MKSALRDFIHKLIILLRLEPVFISLGKQISVFNKLVPVHTEYKEGSARTVKRGGVIFDLDISDYMQWFLFVDSPDLSLTHATKFIAEHSAVLDIGSNVGHFSLKLAQAINAMQEDISIYAFEPSTWVCERFERNLSLNPKVVKLIKLNKLALGATDGEAEFVSGKTNSGGGHFVRSEQPSEIVKVMKLDSVCEHIIGRRRISFIKVDVEGYEPEVFKGGWKTIKEHKPVLFFEFSPEWYRARNAEYHFILDELTAIGYSLQMESEKGLVPLVNFAEIDSVYQTNILAIPH